MTMFTSDNFSKVRMLLLPMLLLTSTLLGCLPVRDPALVSPLATAQDRAAQEGMPSPTVGQVEANDITIAYERFGPTDRETMLLIMGTGAQLTSWPLELVAELVDRGYHVIRYDNRDVGLSTHFDDAGLPDWEAISAALEAGEPVPLPYTIEDMAQDAVALLDALGIEKAHLVGASMGGSIAQLVAADYPERTLSLTSIMADSGNPALPLMGDPEALESIPPRPPADDLDAYIEYRVKVLQALGSPGYPTEEQTLREWVVRDVERAYDQAGEMRHEAVSLIAHYGDRLTKLKTIQAPTVVVHGTDDPLVPLVSGEDTAANIPNAELRVIPGLGHDIPAELVPEFADAITAAASRAE
jgi:pimeloyl-ACP methyl ester carboxylesterase